MRIHIFNACWGALVVTVWLLFSVWQPAALTGVIWLIGIVALLLLAIARRTLPPKN